MADDTRDLEQYRWKGGGFWWARLRTSVEVDVATEDTSPRFPIVNLVEIAEGEPAALPARLERTGARRRPAMTRGYGDTWTAVAEEDVIEDDPEWIPLD